MPTVRYARFSGQIIAEKQGGSRNFYGADPLGSSATISNSSGNVTDTFFNWASGCAANATGNNKIPV